ncbi:hypothetical protein E4U32_007502, partial [Claviceps aff. humidiphila group G2b]
MTYANLKSIVKKYGEAISKNSSGKLKWYCCVCERYNLVQSLAGAPGGGKKRHLMDFHGYDMATKTFRSHETQSEAANVANAQGSQPLLSRANLFRKKVVNFFIRSHSAFHMIQNESFRELIEFS